MKPRPRVLIADDHRMILEAFVQLLEPRCEIVGAATDGRILIELAAATQPEVIILDIAMPRLNGMDACVQLRQTMPALKFIFLTANEDPDLAAEAIRLGASGYLVKTGATSELLLAVEHALAGKTYITPSVTGGLSAAAFLRQSPRPVAEKLSARQREVLQLLAEGRPMKEIAGMIHVTARTVAFHKYSIMELLGLKTNTELVQYSIEHGLLRKRAV